MDSFACPVRVYEVSLRCSQNSFSILGNTVLVRSYTHVYCVRTVSITTQYHTVPTQACLLLLCRQHLQQFCFTNVLFPFRCRTDTHTHNMIYTSYCVHHSSTAEVVPELEELTVGGMIAGTTFLENDSYRMTEALHN